MSMIINFVRFEVNQLSAFEKIQEENVVNFYLGILLKNFKIYFQKKYDEAYGLLHIDLSELNRKNHAIKIERSQKESILQEVREHGFRVNLKTSVKRLLFLEKKQPCKVKR